MHARTLTILGTAVLGLAALGVRDHAVAQSVDPVAVEKRLETLEKVVIRDTTDASGTVLARLERIEKLLQINVKAAEDDQKTDAKTFEELKTSLITTQRDLEKMERRLVLIENRNLDRKSDDLAREVKSLERSILQQANTLRDLSDRVRKLENVVRP